jgi:cytochrome c-type biogenesis protein CcmE
VGGKLKIAVAIAVLVGSVVWLGMSGYEDGREYYKTVDEFVRLDAKSKARRIRLMGNVKDGSIRREDGRLAFDLTLNDVVVPVLYIGDDPVPDTFKDGASALVDGTVGQDGRFEGRQIQAKCASKYEADPAKAYQQQAGAAAAPGP